MSAFDFTQSTRVEWRPSAPAANAARAAALLVVVVTALWMAIEGAGASLPEAALACHDQYPETGRGSLSSPIARGPNISSDPD